ncbi:alpha/beta hydrolase [Patescibacteria group bacterium]|nr:alpha/beta hydrolase [Patescibacteria group bacterium]
MKGKKIFLKNSDGINIVGILDLPNSNDHFPIVIVLHGLEGNKENLQVWTDMLNPLGIGTFRFDFRGTGESGGKYQNKTLGGFIDDAKAVLNYVYQLKEVDKNKIALLGHSLGGTTAILLSSEDDRISTLAITSLAINPKRVITRLYDEKDSLLRVKKNHVKFRKDSEIKLLKNNFFQDSKDYDLVLEAQKIPYRFLIVVGEKDILVKFQEVKSFTSVIKNAKLISLINSGHNLAEDWGIATKEVLKWLTKRMI